MNSTPDQPNLITSAIEISGLKNIAMACGVSHQSVRKWEKKGKLPRTEYSGETHYGSAIERLTNRQITREQLLNLS
jgi:hypothetical protein